MIETERLVIRAWQDRDRAPFAVMGADPEVMTFLGPLMTAPQTNDAVDRQIALQAEYGHCFWALEDRATGDFLGFCGLKIMPDGCGLDGEIEAGWRLKRAAWGKGYAYESARAVLDWGFANLDIPRIVAMTVIGNTRSWGLMERLGMVRHPDLDFDHPDVPGRSSLKPHIVYVRER